MAFPFEDQPREYQTDLRSRSEVSTVPGNQPTFLATLKLHGHQLTANKVQATHRNAS